MLLSAVPFLLIPFQSLVWCLFPQLIPQPFLWMHELKQVATAMRNVGKERGEGAGCDGSVKTRTVGKERVYGSSSVIMGHPTSLSCDARHSEWWKVQCLVKHTQLILVVKLRLAGDIFLVSDDQGSITVQILILVTTETAHWACWEHFTWDICVPWKSVKGAHTGVKGRNHAENGKS